MNADEVEEMADAMLLSSPLPDADRSDERLPEGSGSDKLLKKGGDKKHPEEEGDKRLPEETPTGKLIMPCTDTVLPFSLSVGFVNQVFSLDSLIPGILWEKSQMC